MATAPEPTNPNISRLRRRLEDARKDLQKAKADLKTARKRIKPTLDGLPEFVKAIDAYRVKLVALKKIERELGAAITQARKDGEKTATPTSKKIPSKKAPARKTSRKA